MTIDTLSRRKTLETERRIRAAAEIADDLRAFARDRGGRFVLFGSFVSGRMRFDSDLDVLVDFDQANKAEAWDFAESIGRKADLDIDLHDACMSKPAFVDRIREDGLILE